MNIPQTSEIIVAGRNVSHTARNSITMSLPKQCDYSVEAVR